MLKKSLLLISIFIMLVGCKVKWVPDYDPKLEEQIVTASKATDKFYLDMLEDSLQNRKYEKYSQQYVLISVEMNSIRLKNEARSNNKDFVIMNKNLIDAFEEAKEFHKSHKTLTNGEIKAYRASLAAFWRPLYMAEIGLKINKPLTN